MTITSTDQLSGYIWFDGNLVDWTDAKIHVLTHSLHYSGAAYEGERAYNGKVFKLAEHTRRLLESAKTLQLEVRYSFDDIIKAHELVLKKNEIKDAYVRPLIWRGSESLGLASKMLTTHMLIAAVPSTPRQVNGLNLHISRWQKSHPQAMPVQCKSSGHYNMMIVAEKEAFSSGFDDALLLDWRGYIAECTTTNIFFCKDKKIVTPIPDAFLNGITRQTVIELAKNMGLEVTEGYLEPKDIEKFDECFITGTAAEVKGIGSIDIGNKKVVFNENEITQTLQQAYANLVRR